MWIASLKEFFLYRLLFFLSIVIIDAQNGTLANAYQSISIAKDSVGDEKHILLLGDKMNADNQFLLSQGNQAKPFL